MIMLIIMTHIMMSQTKLMTITLTYMETTLQQQPGRKQQQNKQLLFQLKLQW